MASDFGPRIADLVEVAATRLPEAPALVVTADRIAISHRDLARLVDELAGQLTRSGLLPGDRVALRMGSNAEFVVALLAASRAGSRRRAAGSGAAHHRATRPKPGRGSPGGAD